MPAQYITILNFNYFIICMHARDALVSTVYPCCFYCTFRLNKYLKAVISVAQTAFPTSDSYTANICTRGPPYMVACTLLYSFNVHAWSVMCLCGYTLNACMV